MHEQFDAGVCSPDHERRRDEMKAISGSRALLTNMELAWNTSRRNDAVERMRTAGMNIDEAWLRRIGPVHFGHINFRGIFRFRIAAHASALLRPGASSGAAVKV